MKLNKDDVIKFYALNFKLDFSSPNIGVIGSNEKFKLITNKIIEQYKDKKVSILMNKANTKLTIIYNDYEITYIHIKETKDLFNKYFKKYI